MSNTPHHWIIAIDPLPDARNRCQEFLQRYESGKIPQHCWSPEDAYEYATEATAEATAVLIRDLTNSVDIRNGIRVIPMYRAPVQAIR